MLTSLILIIYSININNFIGTGNRKTLKNGKKLVTLDYIMGYYQKFHKKNNYNGGHGYNNGGNNWQKPSYRKPPYDPAKAAEKKLKEEEKRLTHEQLEKYIPIFNSLDILHCVGMFNKIRKKITKQSRQILKMLIVNKLLYHNPMIPWEGEIPDEVKEVNEYIEFLKIKDLVYTGKEKPEEKHEN